MASFCQILKAVPNATLHLLAAPISGKPAVMQAITKSGVDESRVVWHDGVPRQLHLERLRHFDLMLDAHYYNAHTSASDALWAGLPILTYPGSLMHSRVAASLIRALDDNILNETMVVHSHAAYIERATRLATRPREYAELRDRLWQVRNDPYCPLFDTAQWVHDLECGIEMMLAKHLAEEGKNDKCTSKTEPKTRRRKRKRKRSSRRSLDDIVVMKGGRRKEESKVCSTYETKSNGSLTTEEINCFLKGGGEILQ